MKTALMTEFSAAKTILLQMAGLYLLIGLMMGYFCESAYAMVACISAMTPIMLTFTCSANDMMNGWERLRATLPVSRTALVISRYTLVLAATAGACILGCAAALAFGAIASQVDFLGEAGVLFAEEASDAALLAWSSVLGACAILVIVSIMMPLILRFGMSLAMRIAPMIMVLAIPLLAVVVPQFVGQPQFVLDAIAWVETHMTLACACAAAATLAIYAASCAIAIAAYRTKEL